MVAFIDMTTEVPYSSTNGLWEADGTKLWEHHMSSIGYATFGRR